MKTKSFPVYILTLGKGGPKMKVTADKPSDLKNFAFRKLGSLIVTNSTMQDFCNGMQLAVMDKPVVDHTGLTDRYDFQLNWTPDESQFASMGVHIPPPNPDDTTAPPGLYTALLQEQLGLKMERDQSDGPCDGDRQGRKSRARTNSAPVANCPIRNWQLEARGSKLNRDHQPRASKAAMEVLPSRCRCRAGNADSLRDDNQKRASFRSAHGTYQEGEPL